MKITTIVFCFLFLGNCGSTWAAEKTSSFDYLYAGEAIKDIVSKTEVVVIGEIRSIEQINSVTPQGNNYSVSSTVELVVSEPLRGYTGVQGDTILLEVPNSYIRYADTFMSVKDYGDFIANNKEQILKDMF